MIQHYLKLAFRNLWKYRTQNAVSAVGLAVGFVAFALSTLWLRYEMTYDDSFEESDRMYMVYTSGSFGKSFNTIMPYWLSTSLTNDFPEVEATCACSRSWVATKVKAEGFAPAELYKIRADSCFMRMFHIRILAGNPDFLYQNEYVALTEASALRIFGTTDVLGREVAVGGRKEKRTVRALVSELPHSNLSFGFMGDCDLRADYLKWNNYNYKIIVRLREGVDAAAFERKVKESVNKSDAKYERYNDFHLIPLNQYRYSDICDNKPLSFQYLVLFSAIGALVVLCALANYLSLFIVRVRMRRREIGLRLVCGSSRWSVLKLFVWEYALLILFSGVLGGSLMELALPWFKKLSNVQGAIYVETFGYFLLILLLSILALLPFLFRKASGEHRNDKHLFRKAAITFQLFIGLLFAFGVGMVMKQLHFLTKGDLGWERQNTGILYPGVEGGADIRADLERMPRIESLLVSQSSLYPKSASIAERLTDWEGKRMEQDSVTTYFLWNCEKLIPLYKLRMLRGRVPDGDETDKVVVNETLARALGMSDPVGKTIYLEGKEAVPVIVVGLVKDFHDTPPTQPTQPYILRTGNPYHASFNSSYPVIQLRVADGMWKEAKGDIDSLFAKKYPAMKYSLINVSESYDRLLLAERLLLKLLGFAALACVLTAAFGIFSFVSLGCEQRRKEIAIRKVNGARVGDILALFAREHLLLLAIAAIAAFPPGYVLMKRWLQSYTQQVGISPWYFAGIFLGAALLIALCIGWRVWQAARSNPAETLKTE
ncbi:MAG: ABC transporter permease [Mediterranea sp.]|jgi:ABC-type antimicrobial peptide transport system permease subunit|nr:ABC transporter permease [Mediterranea sp.]